MGKKHSKVIDSYISAHLKRGHSRESIKNHLSDHGYDPNYVNNQIKDHSSKNILSYIGVSLFLFTSLLVLLFSQGKITGYVIADNAYEGLQFSSGDYNTQTGLIYQGSDAFTEKIYRDKSELSLQGKEHGSLNIIDYNLDNSADLFTTGNYGDDISSNLYNDFSSLTGNFQGVTNSDSCWADFDNNGFPEPALIGIDDNDNKYFIIYSNNGVFQESQTLSGVNNGAIGCFDYNNDGWTDLVVCGETDSEKIVSVYQNNQGSFSKLTDFNGIDFCDITVHDFNNDGRLDFIAGGTKTESEYVINFYENNGNSFSQNQIDNDLRWPSITSADYNLDGNVDFAISSHTQDFSITRFYSNLEFDDIDSLDLRWAKNIFYNDQVQLNFFQTGNELLGPGEQSLKAERIYDFSQIENQAPSIPQIFEYELEDNFIKLSWDPSLDDFTAFPFYHVTAKTDEKILLSTVTPRLGNAETNLFKYIENPNECFSVQVKAIDGSFKESSYSEEFQINCEEEENETVELPAPLDTWEVTQTFNNIKYYAQYEPKDNEILVTEIITNIDTTTHTNIKITHDTAYEITDSGDYSQTQILTHTIQSLAPGERKFLQFSIGIDGSTLNTVIISESVQPEISQEIEETITIVDDKTIIEFDVKANVSNLAEEDVVVRQFLPKCLIEEINVLTMNRIESSQEFTILEEDPLIMWHFDNIIDPERLTLEIDNVANENCTNQIRTEIVAKKFLIGKDEGDDLNFLVLLVTSILLTLPIYFFVRSAKKQHRLFALLSFAILFIILNIFDAIGMLPESIDFLKKLFSWVLILALIYHANLKSTLFAGKTKSSNIFNIVIITAFIFLSIKNITYIAFKTYGKEIFFSDLLLPIIQNSQFLESTLFAAGIILIILATIYISFNVQLKSPSFASFLHKSEYEFINTPWKKPIIILLIFLGFYMAFFNFLFGWFSIAFDGPFLILTVLFVLYSRKHIVDAPGESDTLIEKFMKLFTQEKNLYIAFSALPILVFVVEFYNYLIYMLFGIRSIYFETLDLIMPTITDLSLTIQTIPIYILEFGGFVSLIMLAFLFWWHFYKKRHGGTIKDRPRHPFLYAILTTSVIAYIIRPIFTLSSLDNFNLSGLIILLNNITPPETWHYYLLSMTFVVTYLIYRDTDESNILPYALTLVIILYTNYLFMLSFSGGISFVKQATLLLTFNTISLSIMSIIYIGILIFSMYALIGEFLSLIDEEFHIRKYFHKLFPHKAKLSRDELHHIKHLMEKKLIEGEEDFLIIEQIHKHYHVPLKEISKILHYLENDDDKKSIYHHINHYHHNFKEIKKLQKIIRKEYYKNHHPAAKIIEHCLAQGWSQDDVGAAMMHMHAKRKDKALFAAMRSVSL